MRPLAILALLLIASCSTGPQPLPQSIAEDYGYYVDHPERPIPPDHLCNAYAKAEFNRLTNLGLKPFYIVVLVNATYELHIVTAIETESGPVVYDNLYDEQPIPLSEAIENGYAVRGIEIHGRWVSGAAVED